MTNPVIIGPANMRDESDAIVGAWWNGPNGRRVRYSMSVLWDAVDQGAVYAVLAQAPSLAPYDALRWISADRRITIGYQEAISSFRARLIQWLDRAAYRGKSTGVALAARGWILPQLPQVSVVDQVGQWWTYATGIDPMPAGTQTLVPAVVSTGTWNWDGLGATLWARGWLVIWATEVAWCTQDSTWNSLGTWDDGGAWDFQQPYTYFAGLSALVQDWKAEYMLFPLNGGIIVSFSDAWFQSGSVTGDLPDGTYGHWYVIVNNNYQISRTQNAAYLTGAN